MFVEQNQEFAEDKEVVLNKRFCTETKYNLLNGLVTLINVGISLWAAIERGKADYDMGTGNEVPKKTNKSIFRLFMVIDGLMVMSAILLADALRRLKRQFSADKQV